MTDRVAPDFIIVGAAKAGTTSIAEYLDQHPQVYMSPVKEPHFFATDIQQDLLRPLLKQRLREQDLNIVFESKGKKKLHRAYLTDENQYRKLFAYATEQQLTGEASPSYLFSETAAAAIHQFNPKAKIIILLREPVSRAYSQYLMDLRLGYTTGSFEKALQVDGLSTSKSWGSRSHYKELGLYAEQVQRYLTIFPREQILILLYDELVQDSRAILKKIFHFLGIDVTIHGLELSAKNTAIVPRFGAAQRLPGMERIQTLLQKILGDSKLKSKLKTLLYKKPEYTHPKKTTAANFQQYFLHDIQQLEKITGINLSAWKKIQ